MKTFKTINPYDGKVLSEYSFTSEVQLQESITHAFKAQKTWAQIDHFQRSKLLAALASHIDSNLEEHALMATREMGKLLREARGEVKKGVSLIEHFLSNAETYLKEEEIIIDHTVNKIRYEPLGVILGIMPWNFPYWQILRFAIPAIVAGDSVLVKPAYETIGCSLLLQRSFEKAGFPLGMFQVIYPQLEDLEICYKDKRISGVSFTGSSAAGRIIYQKAAANLKKVVLELGGSDPMIVLDDAEIEMSVKLAVSGRLLNAGQTCIASKRFIVAKGCSAAFTEQLKNAMSTISTGDPCHNGTGLATLFAKRGLETAKRQLELAQQGHAKFILSPKILSETCISPGIITDISVQNPVYHQELFAPVALVYQAESDEDIVRLANDTPFGLAASICGKDAGRMQRIARQLECGSVFFNSNVKSDPRIPFGGVKESGVGRELGRWGIHEFCNIKSYCNIPR